MDIRTFTRLLAAGSLLLGMSPFGATLDWAVAGLSASADPSGNDEDTLGDLRPPKIVRPVLLWKPSSGVARITWPRASEDYRIDVIRGGLTLLSTNGGDFTFATEGCLLDDSDGITLDDPGIPDAGDGYWYLVRESRYQGFPVYGSGTYDAAYPGGSSQMGFRDEEILASGHDCTCYYWCCAVYDSCHTGSVISPGDGQRMSPGTGVTPSMQ